MLRASVMLLSHIGYQAQADKLTAAQMCIRDRFHTDAPGTTISANTSTPMPNRRMLH